MNVASMSQQQNNINSRVLMSVIFGLGSTFFSTSLFAEAQQGEFGGQGTLFNMAMLAVFAFVFYFMILRPQSKRAKQQRDLISNLQKGDEVITAGGILGKVNRIADAFFVLTVAEGVEIAIQKQAVAGVLPKGTIKNI